MLDEYIKRVLNERCIISIPIGKLTQDGLEQLSEKAKENKILVTLNAEYSNVHQGILVNLVRKDIANKFIEWL